jgi:sugar phosphate isomerase/epimerase
VHLVQARRRAGSEHGRQAHVVRGQEDVLDGRADRVVLLDLDHLGMGQPRSLDDGQDDRRPQWFLAYGVGITPCALLAGRPGLAEFLEGVAGDHDEPPRLGQVMVRSRRRCFYQALDRRAVGHAIGALPDRSPRDDRLVRFHDGEDKRRGRVIIAPMLVGAMNFPGRSVLKEIHRIHEDGFDFVDLTIEPPVAWKADGKEAGRLMSDLGLQAVGHTAYYLPIASPWPEMRVLARDLFRRCLDTFRDAGVQRVNVHPDQRVPLHQRAQVRAQNAAAIADLAEDAAARGLTLMVENLDRTFADVADLAPLFDAVPELGFHLDIGHANLRLGVGGENRAAALLDAFGDRLAHVHVSDNRGGADDLHLPLGAGTIDWKGSIRLLKEHGWDGTVTLEVFSREREYLRLARRLWLEWWSER